MLKLLEKAYNCYMSLLFNMNYGKTDTDYCVLYDSVLALDNNITEPKYVQYFENNLLCQTKYPLNITTAMEREIAWFLSPNSTNTSFIWNPKETPTLSTYYVSISPKSGFNYLYFSIPQDVNFIIYNTLDMVLYNSSLIDSADQLFILVGTTTTSKGATNNVYRKKDVYATSTPTNYKISLF
jgi:hypothetical protein